MEERCELQLQSPACDIYLPETAHPTACTRLPQCPLAHILQSHLRCLYTLTCGVCVYIEHSGALKAPRRYVTQLWEWWDYCASERRECITSESMIRLYNEHKLLLQGIQ